VDPRLERDDLAAQFATNALLNHQSNKRHNQHALLVHADHKQEREELVAQYAYHVQPLLQAPLWVTHVGLALPIMFIGTTFQTQNNLMTSVHAFQNPPLLPQALDLRVKTSLVKTMHVQTLLLLQSLLLLVS
jgi:hypothetical protein